MIGFTDLVKCVIVLAEKPWQAAVCVFMSTMSKLSCTKLKELYRISYSKQRLANSRCSYLQICNLCIHLWGVTVVYWASINHKAFWPCYGNMTILLSTCSTLYVCHLPEWQSPHTRTPALIQWNSMTLAKMIFLMWESLSHSSCKRSKALNLNDRSQIFLKKTKTNKQTKLWLFF